MKHRTPARLAAALVGGSALAFAVPALPAVGESSPPGAFSVEIGDGQIVARGAQAQVTYLVQCPAGSSAFLSASLTQRVGNGVADGFAGDTVECTGAPQSVTLLFSAQSGGKAFRKGVAATRGELGTFTFPDGPAGIEFSGPVTLQR